MAVTLYILSRKIGSKAKNITSKKIKTVTKT